MMWKHSNGECNVYFTDETMARVNGVFYNGRYVWISLFQGIGFGKYVGAYYIDDNGKYIRFGEIKFTVGCFSFAQLKTKYVLCVYDEVKK